jgi:NAD+ kinase
MKVAIYGRPIRTQDFRTYFTSVVRCLEQYNVAFEAIGSYQQFLKDEYEISCDACDEKRLNPKDYACLISFGGDGTMLDTLALVKDTGLPVLGINLGRLGFLANIKMDEFETAIVALLNNNFDIDERAVLEVQSNIEALQYFPYALNDFVVQKRDSSAMITVKTDLNGDFLNNYWADGLIVATPTGSSGYSMSCGGPLLFPGSQAFVITPIAAHNLTVRPAVIPDKNTLSLTISGRGKDVLVTLDSRSFKVPNNSTISIKKGDFYFNMIQLKGATYMDTIRNKLLWGADKRDQN